MNIKVRSLLLKAAFGAALSAAAACNHPASGTQSALAPAAPPAGQRTQEVAGDGPTFQLQEGSFALGNRDGDGIAGTYTGVARLSTNGQKASLTLQISSGSGAFAGAAGSLVLKGEGSFADEGGFDLDGGGDIVLPGGSRSVVVNLRGTAVAGCSASQLISISQNGQGTLSRAGRIAGKLSHQVANTGCS
jgi:hypothetical protein